MTTRFVSGWMAFVFVAAALAASPRDAQWEQVRDARQKGLPKSAVAALEPIIAGAMADKAYPEAIKAIAEKVAFEGEIQGNRAEEKIVRFQTELDKAPAPMKPVMEAILAHWYWQYFQQNPWRFLQRTQTAVSPGPDIQTWDLARILAEIDRHFTAALANEKELKATPIADYDALLTKGTVPDDYRPTLFDFLVYDALSFYQTGEQGVTIAEQTFEVTADSPVFGTVRQFLAWPPETTDP
ncbi:MAG TPA: hypothetical protein VHE61_22860, partial [Opitutaceae bacterium]|nr:hypothetical protein [Opitutaceae bacterium]